MPNKASSLWSSVKSFFLGNAQLSNSVQLPGLNTIPLSQQNFFVSINNSVAVVADIDIHRAIDAYECNPVVKSIVDIYSSKVAEVPRYLEEANDDNVVSKSERKFLKKAIAASSPKRDLQRLLNRPNSYESGRTLIRKIAANYKLLGEAFIFLNRGDQQSLETDSEVLLHTPVVQMEMFSAEFIEVIPDPENMNGGCGGYIYTIDGMRRFYRKENIIHIKGLTVKYRGVASYRPQLRGVSPLKAGSKKLQLSNDIDLNSLRMVQNDGVKMLFVPDTQNPQDIAPGQADDLRKTFSEQINNPSVKGAVGYLNANIKGINLSNSVDMKLIQMKDSNTKDLCALLGLPFEKYESATTFNNKETSFKGWVLDSIVPDCNAIDDELNLYLLDAFNLTDVVISSDFSVLKELDEKIVVPTDCRTPNEIRIAQGYDPIPLAIYDQIMFTNTMIPGNEIMNELAQINQPTNQPLTANE